MTGITRRQLHRYAATGVLAGLLELPHDAHAGSETVKRVTHPGSLIKLSDTAAWRWISGQDGGSRSVLYHATRSICWCCTLGESEYRAVQPPRVRSLVLGQGGALPPDTVAGGETRDAA